MAVEMVKVGCLVAPAGYWMLPACAKVAMCNGCGPAGGFIMSALTLLIPDSLLGLSILEACNIHDYCCAKGEITRKQADNLFFDNMSALIDDTGGPLRPARHVMAFHYFLAVRTWSKTYAGIDKSTCD